MTSKIRWIEQDNEKIALRKSFDGWRVVYPIKNEDGKINWKNLLFGGSYWNFFKVLLIFGLIFLFFFVYKHDTALCRETVERDIAFWENWTDTQAQLCGKHQDQVNISNLYNFVNE